MPLPFNIPLFGGHCNVSVDYLSKYGKQNIPIIPPAGNKGAKPWAPPKPAKGLRPLDPFYKNQKLVFAQRVKTNFLGCFM
jgi:hypothetical protein